MCKRYHAWLLTTFMAYKRQNKGFQIEYINGRIPTDDCLFLLCPNWYTTTFFTHLKSWTSCLERQFLYVTPKSKKKKWKSLKLDWKKNLCRPLKSACASPPTAGFFSLGAGQNALCSAFNCSCYWMINLATQLNMEPITVSGRQHVHVCVSPWSKFAAFSCRANSRVHIFSHRLHVFWLLNCVSVLANILKSRDDLHYSVTFLILRMVNIWRKLFFYHLETLTLCSLSTWVHLKKLGISDNKSTVSVKYSISTVNPSPEAAASH